MKKKEENLSTTLKFCQLVALNCHVWFLEGFFASKLLSRNAWIRCSFSSIQTSLKEQFQLVKPNVPLLLAGIWHLIPHSCPFIGTRAALSDEYFLTFAPSADEL